LPLARFGRLRRMSHTITAALTTAPADRNITALVGLPSGPTTPTTHATKTVPPILSVYGYSEGVDAAAIGRRPALLGEPMPRTR
jgi:hypothetical protein